MSTASSKYIISTQAIQPVPEGMYSREDLSVFFSIGIVINIVMVIGFFVWAVKQWRKHDSSEK